MKTPIMAVFNTGSKMISKYNLQRKKLSGRFANNQD